jgi:hypothetical protein
MLKNVARPTLSFVMARTLLPVDLTKTIVYPGDPELGRLHVPSTETNMTLILVRARTTSTIAFT